MKVGSKRREPRRAISFAAHIYFVGVQTPINCTVRDVSNSGAHLQLPKEGKLPPVFDLSMGKGDQVIRRCRVVWHKGNNVGVEFKKRHGFAVRLVRH